MTHRARLAIGILATLSLAACGGAEIKRTTRKPGPMPSGGDFDGCYQSDFGRLEITREGNRAIGLYEGERKYGRIEGEINGDLYFFAWTQWEETLRGKPRESSGRGVFQYVVEEVHGKPMTMLKGEWGYGQDETGNVWNAHKLERSKKKLKPREGGPVVMDDDYEAAAGFEDGKQIPTEPDEVQLEDKKKPQEQQKPEESGGLDDIF